MRRLSQNPFNWHTLVLGEAAGSSDTNSLLSGTPTSFGDIDLADQQTATPDPGDCAFWHWPAYDVRGTRLSGVNPFLYQCLLEVTAAPGQTTDTVIYIGIGEDTALANDAWFGGLHYNGSTITARAVRISSGTATASTGSGDTSITKLQFSQARGGTTWGTVYAAGLSSANAQLDFANRSGTADLTGNLSWFVAVGRVSTTAGAVSNIAFTPRVIAYPAPVGGLSP